VLSALAECGAIELRIAERDEERKLGLSPEPQFDGQFSRGPRRSRA